jgi:hypothetical protein
MTNEDLYSKFSDCSEKELNKILIEACYDGKLEIIKYVLESENLKEHANIHYNRDNSFYWLLLKEHFDIIEYLIYDYKIEKTELIELHLNSFKNKKFTNKIKEMFNNPERN